MYRGGKVKPRRGVCRRERSPEHQHDANGRGETQQLINFEHSPTPSPQEKLKNKPRIFEIQMKSLRGSTYRPAH